MCSLREQWGRFIVFEVFLCENGVDLNIKLGQIIGVEGSQGYL